MILLKDHGEISEKVATITSPICEVNIAMGELVDKEKEIARLSDELEKTRGELARARAKLQNPGFLEKAPKNLVENEREKEAKYVALCAKLEEKLSAMREL